MKIKKHYLLLIILAVLFCGIKIEKVLAGKAEISWTAPTTNSKGEALTSLGGYKIYWGTSPRNGTNPPGNYSNSKDVGMVTVYALDDIADTGTTYFSVVAYDNSSSKNESIFSEEVKKTPGDINKDGRVDIFDYNSIKDNFGKTDCNSESDINLDCAVDIFDYNALKVNFGASS